MAMNMAYSWIIYSCLIFGSGILCDRKLEKRQAVTSCLVNTEEKFNCGYGMSIELSRVCDGFKDCSDGSDETNESCAQAEYGTTTDCGRLNNITQGSNKYGQKALVKMAPWNVAIYRFNKKISNYELICGGSIISSNLVISAAHCFWKRNVTFNRILINSNLYKIGFRNNKKNVTFNSFTQLINIEIVYLKDNYYGNRAFHAEDIAIIVLKDRVRFNNGVAPVCIDWNVIYNEVNGDQGMLVGWKRKNNDVSSNVLLEIPSPYIDRKSCRKMYKNEFVSYITFDKFCAGSELVSEQGVDMIYGGVGLSFFHNNSYYLTGVISTKDPETNNSISAFTNIKNHTKWIRGLYNRYRRRAVSSCTVNAKDMFNCSNGESIEKSWTCDGIKDCPDGSDETKELCSRNKNETNMTTDCGRVYIKDGLLENNQRALVGTAPWNVGAYRFNKINVDYDFFCGGSLISSKLVVSAAHCFLKNDISFSSNRILTDDDEYKIAVGKYSKSFARNDKTFTQIINVDIVYLKEDYYGRSTFYAEDIAMIVLKDQVNFSYSVSPVCIDWDDKYNEVNGDQGKVVGWGQTKMGVSSNILLEASLPYIDRRICRDMYTNAFVSYVTFDKFCAGSALVSGQGVSEGYGGAGLSFLHSNSYYLTGVTSVKDPESNNSIATFTEVKFHIEWIREIYNKHK